MVANDVAHQHMYEDVVTIDTENVEVRLNITYYLSASTARYVRWEG